MTDHEPPLTGGGRGQWGVPPGGAWIPPENDEAWGGLTSSDPDRAEHLARVRAALDVAAAEDPATLPAVLRAFGMVRTAETVTELLRRQGVIE